MVKKLALFLLIVIAFTSCRTMQNVKMRQVTKQEYVTETEEVFQPGKIICSEVFFEQDGKNIIKLTYQQYYNKVSLQKKLTYDVVYEETSYDEYALIFFSHSDTKQQEIRRDLVKTDVLRRNVLEQDVPNKTEILKIKTGEKITVSVVDISISTMNVSEKTTIVSKSPVHRKAFSDEIQNDGTFAFTEQMYETMLQTARETKAGNEFVVNYRMES